MSLAPDVFAACVEAIRNNVLIVREGRNDKEFHFQNWFLNQLSSVTANFDSPGRNSYPDFCLVNQPEGFEIKGLAYPGRDASYDCNSQFPRGLHNGRTIFYVFGRYPKDPDGNMYPVYDLVICHGSFLNADTTYVHKNKSFRGFGTYGDILVRDRKMYVAPTPYALVSGAAHHRTLILPADQSVDDRFLKVGDIVRREVESIVVSYSFDLQTNFLETRTLPNPNAGREHHFAAYRVANDPDTPVSLEYDNTRMRASELVIDDEE